MSGFSAAGGRARIREINAEVARTKSPSEILQRIRSFEDFIRVRSSEGADDEEISELEADLSYWQDMLIAGN